MLDSLPPLEPIWHTIPADESSGFKWKHARWKPSVHVPLGTLHGTAVRRADGSVALLAFPFTQRVEAYRKALRIIYDFSSWEDLISVAVYRRRVDNDESVEEADHPFYLLAEQADAQGFFRPVELKYLAERMPRYSAVRGMLLWLAARRLRGAIC